MVKKKGNSKACQGEFQPVQRPAHVLGAALGPLKVYDDAFIETHLGHRLHRGFILPVM